MPWWVVAAGLFLACFVMGIVAVPAGIGGGTLFVPIVGGFFPFHLDFVRGAGLLVALASALSAAADAVARRPGQPRLALPLAVLASASSIGGALLGLALPVPVVQTALGLIVLSIVLLMAVAKKSEFPVVRAGSPVQRAGAARRVRRRRHAPAHRLAGAPHGQRAAVFLGIGVLAGMFGIGAGWANVPALNLLMGAPPEGRPAPRGWCCRWSIRRRPGSTSTRARCCR